MKTRSVLALLLLTLLACTAPTSAQPPTEKVIQLALLLDTSNSMDGLINQAKAQLWSVVNELNKAQIDGVRPVLNIALYEYGNDGLASEKGYIRKVAPFTTDLDLISEKLFALTTNGGSEFCGHVIKTSLDQLEWGSDDRDLRIICIAGNEAFTQGNVAYGPQCERARDKSIIVNTIFCGNYDEGVNTKWQDGAAIAKGKYMNIDKDKTLVFIASPYDDQISKLNSKLNATYLAFGVQGKVFMARQATEDGNAKGFSEVTLTTRAITKSSHNYRNDSWDLVDASKQKSFDITKIQDKDLPDDLQGLSDEEKLAYIKRKEQQRDKIKMQIQKLSKERSTWLANERKAQAQANTLNAALSDAIRKQAEAKGFEFED